MDAIRTDTLYRLLTFPKPRPLVRVRREAEPGFYVCEWAERGPEYVPGDLIVREIPARQLEPAE